MHVAALVSEAFGGHGGIALYNRDLLSALVSREDIDGIDVLPRLVRDSDAAKQQINSASPNIKYIDSVGSLKYLGGLSRMLINNVPYGLIICGHINLLPAAELLRRRYKAPLVLFIYGIDAWQSTSRRIVNFLVRKVDAVVSISDFTRQRFLDWSRFPAEPTYILPNALHNESYGVSAKPDYLLERYKLNGCTVILTIARLDAAERYKGIDELIDLLPQLLEHDSNIRYVIAGDGDDRERLMSHAETKGIADKVIFAGNIREKEKADHFRLADAYVMVGRGEGFGFVYLEAMACGIPVVASSRDGSREAVKHGELGLLADPDDTGQVKEQVIAALTRPRRIPEGLAYFYYPRFRQRLGDIVTDIIGRHGAAA